MLITFFCVFALTFEGIIGRPSQTSIEDDLKKLHDQLISNDLDKSLSAWSEHSDRVVKEFGLELAALKDGDLDTCTELKAAMNAAHQVADQAVALNLEIAADLSDIITSAAECITINPFVAVNCAAHKVQDSRAIYKKYQDQLVKVNGELLGDLKDILIKLLECMKRLES